MAVAGLRLGVCIRRRRWAEQGTRVVVRLRSAGGSRVLDQQVDRVEGGER